MNEENKVRFKEYIEYNQIDLEHFTFEDVINDYNAWAAEKAVDPNEIGNLILLKGYLGAIYVSQKVNNA